MRVLLVLAVLALGAARADAATFCVEASAPACVDKPSLAAALTAAEDQPGVDTIRIGRRTEAGSFADARGEPVRIVGAGRTATVLEGALNLGEDESSVAALAVRAPGATALALRGAGDGLRVDGGIRLRDGAALRSSVVTGPVITAGDVVAHSVLIAGTGIDVESGALTARHLTVYGAGAVGVRIAPGALATVADSIVWGFGAAFSGSFAATHSDYPGVVGAVDPGFAGPPTDLGLGARSPLIDAGDPAPLDDAEPLEDAAGTVRAVDGDGDGTAQRDVGRSSGGLRHRRPRAATCWPTRAPSRARWRRTTPRARRRRAGPEPGRSPASATARSPGRSRSRRSTSGSCWAPATGSSRPAPVAQRASPRSSTSRAGRPRSTRVPVHARTCRHCSAASVRSEDRAIVSAEFRGPTGLRRGGFALDSVTAAERGHATMLTARVAERRLPRLTRSIAVTVRAGTPGGSYNDAYADDIVLIPRVPRLPASIDAGSGRRPFADVLLLSRRVRIDRHGSARVRIGCAERNGRALRRRGDARPEAIRRARHAACRAAAGARPARAHPTLPAGAALARSPAHRGSRVRGRARRPASPARPSRRCGSCAAVNLAACFSSLTSATRRPTSARSGTESWSSTGDSPPCASRPPTSSGPRCGAC